MNERLYAEVKKAIGANEQYSDYPSVRYTIDPAELSPDAAMNVPTGPWDINNTDLPSADDAEQFTQAGYTVDSLGRPLHPHFFDMVTDPAIGVVSGRGRYWNWGPNFTADPIVMTTSAQPRVLLIKRGDTGAWALPGGFVDPTDVDVLAAAKRELYEETGLALTIPGTEVYTGVVGDLRTTAHAWAETGAYLLQVAHQVPVAGMDDATDAKWVRIDQLQGTLFGSHAFLIDEALQVATIDRKKSIATILSAPSDTLEVETFDAGHMAYDHQHVHDNETHIFVKRHVAERFTDTAREKHSRRYLQKEYAAYEYVAERGFSNIPERVELIGDTVLAMDALREEDGWIWRAPDDATYHKYVTDILASLDALQSIPTPLRPSYHEYIAPSHDTFWKEGWDELTDMTIAPLIAKIRTLYTMWSEDQKAAAEDLIAALPLLTEHARFIERDVQLSMAHNDARQSNIAWHPTKGASLVDWSWSDPAPKHADATMFLIDLVKSGHDVTPYVDHVNKDQLITLIGFWLAHSVWNTRDGSTTVREQQVASATAAYTLLNQLQTSEKTVIPATEMATETRE